MRRVGIDLALKAHHRATVFEDAVQVGKPFSVRRTAAGIDALVRRATSGTDQPCEFIMEPTGLAWLGLAAELERRGHHTYVPKAQKTHLLRKFLAQFAKTDTADAKAQALVRHVDPDGVYRLHVPSAAETTLRLCVKQRARLVVDVGRAKRRVLSWLILANPHLGDALGDDAFNQPGTAFLRRYIDPFAVQTLGIAKLRKDWATHARGVDGKRVAAVWEACEATCALYAELRAAGRLPFDYAVMQELVRQELERIEYLENQVAALDERIRATYRLVDPDRLLETEVPGIGAAIAPTIEAFVSDIDRFGSAKRFAAYFGIVPRTRQTGGQDGKPGQRLTKGGPGLLRQYMFLAAEVARRCDPALAAAYEKARARGKHHYHAVIIVAHKLLRKIYAVLKLRAAAQRAKLEGRTPPRVAYDYCDPETGQVLTKAEARAVVEARYPSKAEKVRRADKKRAVQTLPQPGPAAQTGSSEDATKEVSGTPPEPGIAGTAACEKPVKKPVLKSEKDGAKKPLL